MNHLIFFGNLVGLVNILALYISEIFTKHDIRLFPHLQALDNTFPTSAKNQKCSTHKHTHTAQDAIPPTLAVMGHRTDKPLRSPARKLKVEPGSVPGGTGSENMVGSPLDSVETAYAPGFLGTCCDGSITSRMGGSLIWSNGGRRTWITTGERESASHVRFCYFRSVGRDGQGAGSQVLATTTERRSQPFFWEHTSGTGTYCTWRGRPMNAADVGGKQQSGDGGGIPIDESLFPPSPTAPMKANFMSV